MILSSQVVITSQIGKAIKDLEALRQDEHIVEIITPAIAKELYDIEMEEVIEYAINRNISSKDTLLVEDSKLAIEKAYISSEVQTIIILASKEFTPLIQNKLLKVIEEPPARVDFILLTQAKAMILPTIRSRLPMKILKSKELEIVFDLNVDQLDLKIVYEFIQEHKRINTIEAKEIVQRVAIAVMRSQKFILDATTLQLFHNAFKALEFGSSPQFILTTLFLKLLAKKRR